jgi:hypothetical protein
MRRFKGIKAAQRNLVDILASRAYDDGKLTPQKKAELNNLIIFCAEYYRHRDIQELNDHDFEHYHWMNPNEDEV